MKRIFLFLMTNIAVLVVAGIVVWLVGLLVDKTGLSGTDRMLGVVFGAARGVIIASMLVLLAGLTPMPRDPWWQSSVLMPHFQQVAEQLRSLLPPEIGEYVSFRPTPEAVPQGGREPAAVLIPGTSG